MIKDTIPRKNQYLSPGDSVTSADDKQKPDRIAALLSATANDVVVICPRGDGGAKNTYDYLKKKGIDEKRIFILKEGMQSWQHKELTVVGK